MKTQSCGHHSTFGTHGQHCESCFAFFHRYVVYCGPTLVASTAQRLRDAGFTVSVEGTEHVYFGGFDRTPQDVLDALPTWKLTDVNQLA
jgi:hypothetical protein